MSLLILFLWRSKNIFSFPFLAQWTAIIVLSLFALEYFPFFGGFLSFSISAWKISPTYAACRPAKYCFWRFAKWCGDGYKILHSKFFGYVSAARTSQITKPFGKSVELFEQLKKLIGLGTKFLWRFHKLVLSKWLRGLLVGLRNVSWKEKKV